jgi:hypothetical protein
MTIIVAGYIIGYPLGGMTWHHLQYLAGLHEMGHEVWFYEDSGEWLVPYNPVSNTCEPNPMYGINYLKQAAASIGLPVRYCYYSELLDTYFGTNKESWLSILSRADVLLAVSGVTPWRDEFKKVRRTCVVDTDPVFTQLRMMTDESFKTYYKQFDCTATFGRLIGTAACELPTHGFKWIATNQPVALSHWPVTSVPGGAFSTIGKWDHGPGRSFSFAGKTYASSKGVEWMKLLDLPGRVTCPLEMAMASMPGDIQSSFTDRGWRFIDATAASISPGAFRDFVQTKAGELTVAKQIYAGLPSGWFSDRSACFLASGKPVVTQSSGFEQWLPTGEGLFSFNNVDQAADALNMIHANYPAHARAARNIAETHFGSRRVLQQLLSDIGA